MRIQSLIRMGAAIALLVTVVATNEGLSQRDRAGGDRSAGHRSKSAPKQVSAGPAMSRPAPDKDRPESGGGPRDATGKGAGATQRPSGGGGRDVAGKTGGFQRPNAGPGAGPKTGGDKRPPANVAGRPAGPSRPGGAASSTELNDFIGGGRSGAPGKGPGDRTDIGKGDRPGVGKGDRTDISKGGRPDLGKGKKTDLGKGDRTDFGKDAQPDVNIGEVNVGSGNTTNYTQNKQAWVDNRQATGNRVRANAGNRYASAYTSGAYRRGAAGGYPYSGG